MAKKQSMSGYFRQHLAEINEKIYFGYSQESIIEELEKKGMSLTRGTFKTLLYRARKQAAESNNIPAQKKSTHIESNHVPEPKIIEKNKDFVVGREAIEQALNQEVDLKKLASYAKKKKVNHENRSTE